MLSILKIHFTLVLGTVQRYNTTTLQRYNTTTLTSRGEEGGSEMELGRDLSAGDWGRMGFGSLALTWTGRGSQRYDKYTVLVQDHMNCSYTVVLWYRGLFNFCRVSYRPVELSNFLDCVCVASFN